MGGPRNLDEIELFLRELFLDVLPIPKIICKPLASLIAKRRADKVKPMYQAIGNGSPISEFTNCQAKQLKKEFARVDENIAVRQNRRERF